MWAIVEGLKPVENRTRRTSYRDPLLIHAGLQDDLHGWQFLDEMGFPLPVDPPTGGIIGVVDLVEGGSWHWLLANPRPPVRGLQRQVWPVQRPLIASSAAGPLAWASRGSGAGVRLRR